MNCITCNETVEDEYMLEIHRLKNHVNASSKCLLCDKSFKSITHHLKRRHPEEYSKKDKNLYTNSDELKCKFCGMEAAMMQHLIKHIKVKHIEERCHCEVCDIYVKNLYDHNVNHHSDDHYTHKCDICNISFKTKRTYNRHLLTEYHKTKTTEIDILDIERQVKQLKIDSGKTVRTTTPNPITSIAKYMCNQCNPPCEFRYKSGLVRHTKSFHTTDTDKPQIKCDHCDVQFTRTDILKRHIKDVHNPTYVNCPTCNKKILERKYYETHLKLCLTNRTVSQYPGSSKHEKAVSKYLIDHTIEFECQKKFPDFKDKKPLSFDFFVPSKNVLIEVQGGQHYMKTSYPGGEDKFKEVQDRDVLKQRYAEDNGYNYLVLDTRKDYVTELANFFS